MPFLLGTILLKEYLQQMAYRSINGVEQCHLYPLIFFVCAFFMGPHKQRRKDVATSMVFVFDCDF